MNDLIKFYDDQIDRFVMYEQSEYRKWSILENHPSIRYKQNIGQNLSISHSKKNEKNFQKESVKKPKE